MKTLVDWTQIEYNCKQLVTKLETEYTHVAGVSVGGVVPAAIITKLLNVPNFLSFSVKSYTDNNEKGPIITSNLNSLINLPDRSKVLIVDDIADTGHTIQHIRNRLHDEEIVFQYHIATLYKKTGLNEYQSPDFFSTEISDHRWLVFPWESL